MWDTIVAEVSKELPQFNKELLLEFRQRQVNRSIEYMDNVYKQAVRALSDKVQVNYLGYRIMSPDEQVKNLTGGALNKDTINVQRSEAVLVEFGFEYNGEKFAFPLFLPYLHNNVLVTNDTEYTIEHTIVQTSVVRTNEGRGIIIKVLQSPLRFWRNLTYAYTSTDGRQDYDNIITTQAHYRTQETKKAEKTTVVLYLLAEYGFIGAMKMFSIEDGILGFVDHVPAERSSEFRYYEITPRVFLKVRDEIMEVEDYRRIVASILYIWSFHKDFTMDISYMYSPECYKMILGKIIYDESKPTLAAGHGESHLESLRAYLDKMTQTELEREINVHVENVFQLFVHVFYNINGWLANYSANDLFEKRLRGVDMLFTDTVEKLFKSIYNMKRNNKKKSDLSAVSRALRLNPTAIMDNLNGAEGVKSKPAFYNDNILLSMLIKKIRPDQSKENGSSARGAGGAKKPGGKSKGSLINSSEHKFSPTFLAVESVWSLPSSNPGIAGDINPFVEIDEFGNFRKDKMPWYKEIEPVGKYL